jgi:DNA-binding beta-propeller fold protein YncE
VYVGSRGDGVVSVVDARELEEIATVLLGPDARAQGVAVHPESGTVLAVDQRNATVSAFSEGGETVDVRRAVGEDPYELALDGDRVLVPGRGDGTVHEFDLAPERPPDERLVPETVHDGFGTPVEVHAVGDERWVVDLERAVLRSLDGRSIETPAPAIAAARVGDRLLLSHYDDAAVSLVDPAEGVVWRRDPGAAVAAGPAPVLLGKAGEYVILAKSSITTTGTTDIVGDVAISPAARSFMTGFDETLDATTEFATSALVTGQLFAADMSAPTPSNLTTAVSNMETAYVDAAGRTNPDETELGAGDISGLTLEPGLYAWSTDLLIASDVTLSGSENDVWILQIAQNLTLSNGVAITLEGGALPENIFWQVAGEVTLGTTSDFKGIILSKTKIVLQTGAVLNGRALAQTAVTMDANAVTQPAQ